MNQPVQPIAPPAPSAPPSAANPTTAGAVASSNASQAELSSTSTISSLADLKRKAPQVYNMMMQGIAMNICNDMQNHQDHLKQMMDEAMNGG